MALFQVSAIIPARCARSEWKIDYDAQMPPSLIRDASVSDAHAIAGLHLRSWRAAYETIAPAEAVRVLTEAVRRERWTAMLAAPKPRWVCRVVDAEGAIQAVGVACAPSEALFGERGEVRHLYVEPDLRRAGLGRRMMAELTGVIAHWGYGGLALSVVVENAPARAFYASLAGREIGRFTDPGPVWKSENIALGWDDLPALTARCGGGA